MPAGVGAGAPELLFCGSLGDGNSRGVFEFSGVGFSVAGVAEVSGVAAALSGVAETVGTAAEVFARIPASA